MALTKAEKAAAQAIFTAGNACGDCGGIHQRACPRVKRQAWVGQGSGAGTRIEVEYWPPGWDDTGVIWPEDAFEPEDAEAPDG